MNDEPAGLERGGLALMGARPAHVDGEGDEPRCLEKLGSPRGPRVRQEDGDSEGDRALLPRNLTLLRQLEHAREQRGSPSLWDAVAARLDSEDRQRNVVAPMLRLLDQIHERVDDETWGLILDFEWRSSREVMAGVEVGLELGYASGRAAAFVEAQPAPGQAAEVLRGRLADLVGATEVEHSDVLLALVATLQAAVMMNRGGPAMATPSE